MYGSDGITVLRVFNLLTGDIYKKDQVGKLQFKYERMSMEELCDHLQDIQQAIQCEYLENEGANGMTVYLERKNLKSKKKGFEHASLCRAMGSSIMECPRNQSHRNNHEGGRGGTHSYVGETIDR